MTDARPAVPTAAAPSSPARTLGRLVLGGALLFTGTAHLTTARETFQAQVPPWLPLDADLVVVISGIVELALGAALILLPRHRVVIGWVVAAFFVVIFPGNISQYVTGTSAFGLDTDAARLVRLFFQPVLVVWALWSTGAWAAWRTRRGYRTGGPGSTGGGSTGGGSTGGPGSVGGGSTGGGSVG